MVFERGRVCGPLWSSQSRENLSNPGNFRKKGLYLEFTGIKEISLREQLENFIQTLGRTFYPGISLKSPIQWRDALEMLTQEIEKLLASKKILLFLDELPWMAGKRSGFLACLDTFWNTRWSRMANLKVIVCGSAASWILENIINSKGGLYNRLTRVILLEPFTLKETKEFLASRSIKLKEKQVLDLYMVMGGIPHYLKQVERGKSPLQNINDICFRKEGVLYSEFSRLFRSLFDAADIHEKMIRTIAQQ